MSLSKYRYLIFIFIIILLLVGCTLKITKSINAEMGVLDLSIWDFKKDGNIDLNGEWEFYWKQLLSCKDLHNKEPDFYSNIPATWDVHKQNGHSLSSTGYGTYRIHVKTQLPPGTSLGIRAGTFSSAYRLYIDNELIGSNGRVAMNGSEEIGEYRPQALFFKVPASEFDIIIQVSNFQYARGGFWYVLRLGDAESIGTLHDQLIGKEFFLLGALLIVSLFFFFLYFLIREVKYTLYFALFCLLSAVAIDMVSSYTISRAFSFLSFQFTVLLWYSSTGWVLFFLLLYVSELLPSKLSSVARKAYFFLILSLQLIYILTPSVFYTRLGHFSNYTEILVVVLIVVIIVSGIKKGEKEAWLHLISMVILLLTYLHDILYWTNIIRNEFGELFFVGVFLFLFIQILIQSKRIKLYFDDKRVAELAFLQSQIKPHFLYNAINTFIDISYYDINKARSLLESFSHYLRRSFDFKDLSHFVPLKHEIELAKTYVEIEKARFEDRLEINFDIPENLEMKVPMIMLQPIIENAVIHGILPKVEGGSIDVSIFRKGNLLVFSVKDNGIGMDAEKLEKIFEKKKAMGVGIANINQRLYEFFGTGLNILSSPGKGTEVKWSIPTKGLKEKYYD